MKKTIALIIAVFAVFTSYARKETASHVFFIGLPDFGNDSPYLFTPMYEASFKGTKR